MANAETGTRTFSAPTTGIVVDDNGLILTPKRATIVASSSGVTSVVGAVTGKKIRVLSFAVSANAAVNVKFQSATTPTDLTGLMYLTDKAGFGASFSPAGHFETIAGEQLSINLSGAVAVGGFLTYVEA